MRFMALLLVVVLAGCMDDDGNATSGDTQGPTPTQDDEPDQGNETTGPDADPQPENETQPRAPVTWTITISGNDFVDGSITVQQGDTVTWVQEDTVPHTVTSDDGTSFHSGDCPGPSCLTLANDEFSHTFDMVGEYPYHCEVHPSMTDKITVLEVYLEEP